MPTKETTSRPAAGSEKVYFRLACACDVYMGRFVVSSIDDKPESVGTVNDNHREYNLTVGLFKASSSSRALARYSG